MGAGEWSASDLDAPSWRAIAENSSDALFVARDDLEIVWVNARACEMLEYPREQLVGKNIAELLWDAADLRRESLRPETVVAGVPTESARRFRSGKGARRLLEVHARKLADGLLVGVARDVTLGEEALDRLAMSEASFRALIDRSPDAMLVHSRGKVLYANSTATRMLGYDSPSDLVGKPVFDLVHPDDREAAMRRVQSLRDDRTALPIVEERLIRRDGSVLTAGIGAVRVLFDGQDAIAATARDNSPERTVAAQIARTERMAALGMLSAGVAHEINNPLGYLMLRLEAIQSLGAMLQASCERMRQSLVARLGESDAATVLGDLSDRSLFEQFRDHVQTAREGAQRVREIVHQLHLFSRVDTSLRSEIDLRGPLEAALGLTRHEIAMRARIVTDFEPVPRVMASEGRLTQVFVNLLLNASQAIAEGDPEHNEVRVATRAQGVDVCVAISDTGAGVAPENVSRLFEPFFTTKPEGIGTGLGLSICHGIVSSLGGAILVDTHVGRGTTFTVVLPSAPNVATDGPTNHA
jgi:PAS domain S-box-containing protein